MEVPTIDFLTIKPLFSSLAKLLMTCLTEKGGVSSANDLTFDDKALDKSFMKIKKQAWTKDKSLGNSSINFVQENV